MAKRISTTSRITETFIPINNHEKSRFTGEIPVTSAQQAKSGIYKAKLIEIVDVFDYATNEKVYAFVFECIKENSGDRDYLGTWKSWYEKGTNDNDVQLRFVMFTNTIVGHPSSTLTQLIDGLSDVISTSDLALTGLDVLLSKTYHLTIETGQHFVAAKNLGMGFFEDEQDDGKRQGAFITDVSFANEYNKSKVVDEIAKNNAPTKSRSTTITINSETREWASTFADGATSSELALIDD
jgi:hypothetical protein